MPSEESGFLGIGIDSEYDVNDEESAIRTDGSFEGYTNGIATANGIATNASFAIVAKIQSRDSRVVVTCRIIAQFRSLSQFRSGINLDSIITDALLAQNGSHGRIQKIY